MFFLLFFIFSIFKAEIPIGHIRTNNKQDYKVHKIETEGSWLRQAANSRLLFMAPIVGTMAYLKYKKTPIDKSSLETMIPSAAFGFALEKGTRFADSIYEKKIKAEKTENYDMIHESLKILENNPNVSSNSFLEKYDKQNTQSTENDYKKLNKLILGLEKNDNCIYPERINKLKKEEKLLEFKMKTEEENLEKARLERIAMEAELKEKQIIKIFDFKELSRDTKLRNFYGWEKYIQEKAALISEKITAKEPIEQNTLLYGPPGCGKTSYVENVAINIAMKINKNVIYYNVKNADIKTAGQDQNRAVSNIKQLFEQIKEKAKENLVVLFLDEFDGISTSRESKEEKSDKKINHQNNDITAILLQEIEQAHGVGNIVIFGATNHIENLDSALIRTGRFDHRIRIGKPNIKMREEIIKKKIQV